MDQNLFLAHLAQTCDIRKLSSASTPKFNCAIDKASQYLSITY